MNNIIKLVTAKGLLLETCLNLQDKIDKQAELCNTLNATLTNELATYKSLLRQFREATETFKKEG